jgi:hypothetical protein
MMYSTRPRPANRLRLITRPRQPRRIGSRTMNSPNRLARLASDRRQSALAAALAAAGGCGGGDGAGAAAGPVPAPAPAPGVGQRNRHHHLPTCPTSPRACWRTSTRRAPPAPTAGAKAPSYRPGPSRGTTDSRRPRRAIRRTWRRNNYFSHTSLDGRTLAARVDATGYTWSVLGENIARASRRSAVSSQRGWRAPPLRNVMRPGFSDMAWRACPARRATRTSRTGRWT